MLLLVAALLLPTAASASSTQVMTFEAPREVLKDSSRERTLDEIQGFGVTRVRQLVYWKDFAAQPNSRKVPTFDMRNADAYPGGTWVLLDRLVASIQARGMQLHLTLTGPVPTWATSGKQGHVRNPDAQLFGDWVHAVAARYGDRVDLWSVWNEPNHPDFLAPQYRDGSPASPSRYRKLYVAAEKQLHGVPGGSGDKVLFGETAPIGNQNVVSPLGFLRRSLCLSASYKKKASCRKLRIDGYAHHAYGRKGSPTFRSDDSDEVSMGSLDRLARALDRAAKAGAIGKHRPIYLTEYGVQSTPDKLAGVSLAKQGEYLAIAEHIAYLNPRVKAFSQYLLRDDEPRSGPAIQRYSGFESGLRRSNGTKKPSYNGFIVPLRVTHVGATNVLWGRVRPATTSVDAVIERKLKGDGFKRLTTVRTGRGGVFGLGTPFKQGARYRVRWVRPDGGTVVGPPIRSY
jgi:hypothetical protein